MKQADEVWSYVHLHPKGERSDPSRYESNQIGIRGPIYYQGKRYETWKEYKVARDRPEGSAVEHPSHYNEHPSGVECLDIIRHMNFNLGNVIKYVWRADLKEDAIQDLEKAVFYLQDEIKRRKQQP